MARAQRRSKAAGYVVALLLVVVPQVAVGQPCEVPQCFDTQLPQATMCVLVDL